MTDTLALIEDAEARLRRGDRPGAAARVREIAMRGEELAELPWARVAGMAQALGDYEVAVAGARRVFRFNPGDPVRALQLADLLGESGRTDEALALAEDVSAARPGDPAPHYFVGLFRAQLGDFDEAIARFRLAADLKPDLTAAWEQLSALKRFTPGDPDLDRMKGAVDALSQAGPDVVAPLLYALGKAYDDLDERERAFAAYAEGSRLMGARRPWNPQAFINYVDGVRAGFDRAFVERQTRSETRDDRAIFVTGLPRSGTTLVEQMLAAHSGVKGGGELNLFRLASLPLGNYAPSTIEAAVGAMTRNGMYDPWGQFGESYLGLLHERFGPEGRVVDKTLNHVSLLGAIHLALPGSPMVWVRRDPADTAWSCFRTRFVRGHEWSWSLENIAWYFHGVERLYQHWTGLFGDAVRPVQYETLVSDPESVIPGLLAHAGLSDEPGVRAFHAVERPVATASLAQVRKPLSGGAVGGWRRYEHEMAPFLETWERLKTAG
jgi:tetratricopeptide (TPR) repeat protein